MNQIASHFQITMAIPRSPEPFTLGTFPFSERDFQTKGPCGETYKGTFELTQEGGARVSIKSVVAKGLKISENLSTQDEQEHVVEFYLSAEQLDGRAIKKVRIPPFGLATLSINLNGAAPNAVA